MGGIRRRIEGQRASSVDDFAANEFPIAQNTEFFGFEVEFSSGTKFVFAAEELFDFDFGF